MTFEKDKFYLIRADKAGVFIGKIIETDGATIRANNLRRLYYWSGALDVTQLAKEGVGNPGRCKFSVQLGDDDISTIYNVIEVHSCTEKAIQTIQNVPSWKS